MPTFEHSASHNNYIKIRLHPIIISLHPLQQSPKSTAFTIRTLYFSSKSHISKLRNIPPFLRLPGQRFEVRYCMMFQAASGSQQPQQQPAVFQSARANMMRTWIFLFVAYAICMLPMKVLSFCLVIDVINLNAWLNSSYYPFVASLYFANTIVNPFIFGVKYRKFQDGVRKVFGKYVATFRQALPTTATTNSNSVATTNTVA